MAWIKSSFCKADQPMCVEACLDHTGLVRLRDSKDPDTVLSLDPGDWHAFKLGLAAGDFDDLPTIDD